MRKKKQARQRQPVQQPTALPLVDEYKLICATANSIAGFKVPDECKILMAQCAAAHAAGNDRDAVALATAANGRLRHRMSRFLSFTTEKHFQTVLKNLRRDGHYEDMLDRAAKLLLTLEDAIREEKGSDFTRRITAYSELDAYVRSMPEEKRRRDENKARKEQERLAKEKAEREARLAAERERQLEVQRQREEERRAADRARRQEEASRIVAMFT